MRCTWSLFPKVSPARNIAANKSENGFRLWGKRYMENMHYLKPSLYISSRLSHRYPAASEVYSLDVTPEHTH